MTQWRPTKLWSHEEVEAAHAPVFCYCFLRNEEISRQQNLGLFSGTFRTKLIQPTNLYESIKPTWDDHLSDSMPYISGSLTFWWYYPFWTFWKIKFFPYNIASILGVFQWERNRPGRILVPTGQDDLINTLEMLPLWYQIKISQLLWKTCTLETTSPVVIGATVKPVHRQGFEYATVQHRWFQFLKGI